MFLSSLVVVRASPFYGLSRRWREEVNRRGKIRKIAGTAGYYDAEFRTTLVSGK